MSEHTDTFAEMIGRAGEEKDIRLILAVAISNLSARLGKNPGQLTNQELRDERDRIALIYRNL